MARICADGGRILGADLKEMARVAHTEYLIEGRTEMRRAGDPARDDVRPHGHRQPAGECRQGDLAVRAQRTRLLQRGRRTDRPGPRGDSRLDSSILIRTAEIDAGGPDADRRRGDPGPPLRPDGRGRRDPSQGPGRPCSTRCEVRPWHHPPTRTAPGRSAAAVWTRAGTRGSRTSARDKGDRALRPGPRSLPTAADPDHGRRGHLHRDAGQQLRSLGLAVDVRRFDEPYDMGSYGLIGLGPGPGDPQIASHPKIAQLRPAMDDRAGGSSAAAGRMPEPPGAQHPARPRAAPALRCPTRAWQREIDLFGLPERVGFYNTFARSQRGTRSRSTGSASVEVSRDPETGEVYALRGPGFASMQFHAESVLTVDGPRLITEAIQVGARAMTVTIAWWDLAESDETIEALEQDLRELDRAWHEVKGLRVKLWIADRENSRWGAVMWWDPDVPADQQLPPNRAAELIGRPPTTGAVRRERPAGGSTRRCPGGMSMHEYVVVDAFARRAAARAIRSPCSSTARTSPPT